MANDPDFIEFVVDQIDPSCNVRYRHMFGGTTLYSNDKVVALICDNQLFIKPTEAGRSFIGNVDEAPPYEGARDFFRISDAIEDSEWLSDLVRTTETALPKPKLRTKKARP